MSKRIGTQGSKAKKKTNTVEVINNVVESEVQTTDNVEVNVEEITSMVTPQLEKTSVLDSVVEKEQILQETIGVTDTVETISSTNESKESVSAKDLSSTVATVFISGDKTLNNILNSRVINLTNIIKTLRNNQSFSIGFAKEDGKQYLEYVKRAFLGTVVIDGTKLTSDEKDSIYKRLEQATTAVLELS